MKSFLFWFCLVVSLNARELFVSPQGSDSATGMESAPFKSLKMVFSELKPGDSCVLREGLYSEVASLRGVCGTAESPITIRSYPGERVVLDGTVPIKANWVRHKGNIWKCTLEKDIWQLFSGSRNLTLARWPESRIWTKEFWDQSQSWARSEDVKKGYANGLMVDEDLKDVKVSLKGGVVVINCYNWRSRAAVITDHTPGMDRFEFEKVGHFNPKGSHAYFITSLSLLDSEDEWFYDKSDKTLHLYSESDPSGMKLRGRITDAILVHEPTPKKLKRGAPAPPPAAANVILDGLTFFASRAQLPYVKNLTVRNCRFIYSVGSQRTLGVTNDAPYNEFSSCENLRLINNEFRYCDGKSLVANSSANGLIENNLFYMVDFACLAGGSNSYTVQMESAPNLVYRRNEINTAGASEGMRISGPADAAPLTELNYHTRCGLMQTDGASIQYPPGGNVNSINRYNWFVDVNRTGFRFDGNPGGEWGIVYRNVSALGGHRGYRFKGDNHEIYHNIGMDNAEGGDMSIAPNKGPERHEGKANLHSRVLNNAVQGSDLQKNLIVDAKDKNPNWDGINNHGDLREELRDPDNLDFRPRKGSALIDKGVVVDTVRFRTGEVDLLEKGTPKTLDVSATYNGTAPDLGAYEFGDKNYWIAGRIMPQASRAIPPNGSKTAKMDADLMWLPGEGAVKHQIYVGRSKESLSLKSTQDNNIFVPDAPWVKGEVCYWRVDTITEDGVVKGALWSFVVGG